MYNYFIINPVAGRIKPDEIISVLSEVSRNVKYGYSITEYALHAEKLAYDAAVLHEDIRIYAIGGDGTLNETANGLIKSGNVKASLIPVPLGSGNDFVRSIGYKGQYDLKMLLNKAISCTTGEFDLCRANDRYFLNISSLGFDAQVVSNAIKYKKNKLIPRGITYYLSVFTTFIKMKSYPLTITVDDRRAFSKKMTLVAVANGKYYGGGIMPAPDADLKDGMMDVCLVERVIRLKVPVFFPKYAKGRHGSLREVSFLKCKKLHIKCEEDAVVLNVDGEITQTNEIVFEVCDFKIKIGLI